MRKRYVALDGSVLELSMEGFDLSSSPYTSQVEVIVGDLRTEFYGGTKDFGEQTALTFGVSLGERFTVNAYEVIAGSSEQHDADGLFVGSLVAASLLGMRYCVYVFAYGVQVDTLIGWLGDLRIMEDDDGVTALPTSASIAYAQPASILHYIEGFGLIDVRVLSRPELRRLPKFSGSLVEGGELFVNEDHHGDYYTFVTETAVARIYTERAPEQMPDVLYSLQTAHLEWGDPLQLTRDSVSIGLT